MAIELRASHWSEDLIQFRFGQPLELYPWLVGFVFSVFPNQCMSLPTQAIPLERIRYERRIFEKRRLQEYLGLPGALTG